MKTNTSHSNSYASNGLSASAQPANHPLTGSGSNSQLITLEVIAQRKAQKLEEVRQAKLEMADTLHQRMITDRQ